MLYFVRCAGTKKAYTGANLPLVGSSQLMWCAETFPGPVAHLEKSKIELNQASSQQLSTISNPENVNKFLKPAFVSLG